MPRRRGNVIVMRSELPSALLLALFFLTGGLAGVLLSARTAADGNGALAAYVEAYLAAGAAGAAGTPSLMTLFWDSFRYPLLAALFGFTALGVILLPALMVVRGFFLSFAVASFVRMFGGQGLVLAVCVFGVSCLITVPCLFVIAAQGFPASLRLAGMTGTANGGPLYDSRAPGRFLTCAAALFCCVLYSRFAAPVLLASVAASWAAAG